MWIERVTAHAFGALHDETLDLAPGLSVVVGPNESGKSTWHAALYAGVCGMRRGRGRRHKDDEAFALRHEPWSGDAWAVSSVLTLADGRRVELHHDLAGRVGSTARDLGLGRDVTGEIIFDGAPDGSRWLGLDRRAFQALACVRQADILGVAGQADSLQVHLQRAAATAGTDETAAAALAALDAFGREHIGLERSNSTKPLMRAITSHEAAEARYRRAVEAHEQWLAREGELAAMERAAHDAVERAHAAQALLARQRADLLQTRVERARHLAARHPEPPQIVVGDDLAARVATALHAWEHRPRPRLPVGPSPVDLRSQLDALPAPPEGDLDPHPAVVAARRLVLQARSDLDAHRRHEPIADAGADAPEVEASESELVELARQLEALPSEVPTDLRAEVVRWRETVADEESTVRRTRRQVLLLAVVAVLAACGALASFAAGAAIPSGAGGLVAAVAGVGAVLRVRRRPPTLDTTREALAGAEARLHLTEAAAARSRDRHEAAVARARSLGLDADPTSLRRLADGLRHVDHHRDLRRRWEERADELDAALADAVDALVAALGGRGEHLADVGSADAVLDAADRYESRCREHREQLARSERRPFLQAQLEAREAAEQRFESDRDHLDEVRRELGATAAACGLDVEGSSPDELCEQLGRWRQHHHDRRQRAEVAMGEWSELRALLEGRSLAEWEAEAEREDAIATKIAASVSDEALASVRLGADPERAVAALTTAANAEERALGEARRELEVRAETLDPVAEAAEELSAARAELERVRCLKTTIATTTRFMLEAQDHVHRSIAPQLAERVNALLPEVTGGRYREVTVDPESLKVQVRDPSGRWRDAQHLSHGTAEQVYLLLRVAMAQILATEPCPLLLDDVTVHSDPARTRAILEVLHLISRDHQVVLLSQEDDVRRWAHAELGPTDRLVALTGPR